MANSLTAPPTPQKDAFIGRSLAGYCVERLLGKGGMGSVYLAEHQRLKRRAAVKVLPPHFFEDPAMIERFEREAQVLASLNSRHIVPIYDMFEEDKLYCIVMGYASGGSLRDLCRSGPISEERAAHLVADAARGLWTAAQQGIVHRDVKPDNLLLDEQDRVLIADFGLAKPVDEASGLTKTGSFLGTAAYMSPEQCEDGKSADHRADMYSLGCTLFELLTGEPPYKGPTRTNFIKQHLFDPLPDIRARRAGVSARMAGIVARLLAKKPDERFQTGEQLARELEGPAAGGGSVRSEPTSVLPSPSRQAGALERVEQVVCQEFGVSLANMRDGSWFGGAKARRIVWVLAYRNHDMSPVELAKHYQAPLHKVREALRAGLASLSPRLLTSVCEQLGPLPPRLERPLESLESKRGVFRALELTGMIVMWVGVLLLLIGLLVAWKKPSPAIFMTSFATIAVSGLLNRLFHALKVPCVREIDALLSRSVDNGTTTHQALACRHDLPRSQKWAQERLSEAPRAVPQRPVRVPEAAVTGEAPVSDAAVAGEAPVPEAAVTEGVPLAAKRAPVRVPDSAADEKRPVQPTPCEAETALTAPTPVDDLLRSSLPEEPGPERRVELA